MKTTHLILITAVTLGISGLSIYRSAHLTGESLAQTFLHAGLSMPGSISSPSLKSTNAGQAGSVAAMTPEERKKLLASVFPNGFLPSISGDKDAERAIEKIRDTQAKLIQSIIDEKVDTHELNKKFESFRGVLADERILSGLPPETAENLRELENGIHELQKLQMAHDQKGPEFFQAPAANPAPPAMVNYALALDRLPVSTDVMNHINQVAKAPTVKTEDIQKLAELCSHNAKCIDKGGMIWIQTNHTFDKEQLLAIENSKTGD